ncbi:hypothetical protein AGMMS49960_12480 [Betaproteobacteria bacterium]|nr:hypothetical protein AGMMS49960_12480 [Betaproteobacteria bacterium]
MQPTYSFDKQVAIDIDFFPFIEIMDQLAFDNDLEILVLDSFRIDGEPAVNGIVPASADSNHLVGHAIDINIRDKATGRYYNVTTLGHYDSLPVSVRNFIDGCRMSGMRWGQDFPTPDPVHFDDNLAERDRAAYNKLYTQYQQNVTAAQQSSTGAGILFDSWGNLIVDDGYPTIAGVPIPLRGGVIGETITRQYTCLEFWEMDPTTNQLADLSGIVSGVTMLRDKNLLTIVVYFTNGSYEMFTLVDPVRVTDGLFFNTTNKFDPDGNFYVGFNASIRIRSNTEAEIYILWNSVTWTALHITGQL